MCVLEMSLTKQKINKSKNQNDHDNDEDENKTQNDKSYAIRKTIVFFIRDVFVFGFCFVVSDSHICSAHGFE